MPHLNCIIYSSQVKLTEYNQNHEKTMKKVLTFQFFVDIIVLLMEKIMFSYASASWKKMSIYKASGV